MRQFKKTLLALAAAVVWLPCSSAVAQPPFPPGMRARYEWFFDQMQRVYPVPLPGVPVPISPEGDPVAEQTLTQILAAVGDLRASLQAGWRASKPPQLSAGEGLLLGLALDKLNQAEGVQSFFGLEATKPNLQVAFVIDGTDSMGFDIQSLVVSLQAFAAQVKQVKPDGRVQFAVVVYRDSDCRSGPVEFVLPRFTEDVASVLQALASIEPQTGRPYFPEAVDQGLYAALDQLNWSESDDATRWIMLCGDAPPYQEGSRFRRFSDQQIFNLARRRDVHVNSILCLSGFTELVPDASNFKLIQTALKLRPQLVLFLAETCAATGGRFLDLSDPLVVERLVFTAGAPETGGTPDTSLPEALPEPAGETKTP